MNYKMDIITRRSFLGSLALGSIYPNVEQAAGAQSEASRRKGTHQRHTLVDR